MKTLTDQELMQMQGGFKIGVVAAIASVVTFLIAVVDGYMRPLKCNN